MPDVSLGAIEMGTMISAVLFGMVTSQVHMYAVGCRKDRTWMKILVAFVWALEALHTIALMAYVFDVTVSHAGDSSALANVKWFVVITVILSSLVGSPVQAYFTWRAWVISNRAWYSVPPWFVEFARLIVVAISCVYLVRDKTLDSFKNNHGFLVTATLVTCLFVDTWNSTVLCYHLGAKRIKYGPSIQQISSIIAWSIETNIVICTLAAVSLTLWLTNPGTLLWLCVLMIHAKVYSISMLLSLNARIVRKPVSPLALERDIVLETPPASASLSTPGADRYGQFVVADFDRPEPSESRSYSKMLGV